MSRAQHRAGGRANSARQVHFAPAATLPTSPPPGETMRTQQEAIAARDVVDAVALLNRRRAAPSEWMTDLDPTPSPAERKIEQVVAAIADQFDAVSDLLVAEKVNQLVGGNLEHAAAAYVIASFKETQTRNMVAGQRALVAVDALGGANLHGRGQSIAPASGSEFTLLPFEPGSGNFTKIVQRVAVKIVLDPGQPLLSRLRPGLSLTAKVSLSGA